MEPGARASTTSVAYRCIAGTHPDAAKGSSGPIAISRESDLDGGKAALRTSLLAIPARPCCIGLGAY